MSVLLEKIRGSVEISTFSIRTDKNKLIGAINPTLATPGFVTTAGVASALLGGALIGGFLMCNNMGPDQFAVGG